MSCDRIDPLLTPFVDGELGRHEGLAVRAHVATCAGCARRLETVRAVRSAVRAIRPERSDEGLEDLRRCLRGARRPAAARRRLWTGVAAGLALLVAGSVWVSRGGREAVPTVTVPAPPPAASEADAASPCSRPAECGPDGREVWPALSI